MYSYGSSIAARLVVAESTLKSNMNANANGGALVYAGQGTLLVTGSEFLNNSARNRGGAMNAIGMYGRGSVEVVGCRFHNNSAVIVRTLNNHLFIAPPLLISHTVLVHPCQLIVSVCGACLSASVVVL